MHIARLEVNFGPGMFLISCIHKIPIKFNKTQYAGVWSSMKSQPMMFGFLSVLFKRFRGSVKTCPPLSTPIIRY